MNRFFHESLLLVALVGVLSLAGCKSLWPFGGDEAAVCTAPVMALVGTPDLNSGADGRGNAALVRVYQLAGDAGFRSATFESFWQDDAQALGDELLKVTPKQLYPGGRETFELALSGETRFIGVAVNLRNPDRNRWRAVYSVADGACGETLAVTVGASYLTLNAE